VIALFLYIIFFTIRENNLILFIFWITFVFFILYFLFYFLDFIDFIFSFALKI